jgi:hypothetical protein
LFGDKNARNNISTEEDASGGSIVCHLPCRLTIFYRGVEAFLEPEH